jgi:hypothetical protein
MKNYTPTTLGVQSWREIISGGTRTKKVEYHWFRALISNCESFSNEVKWTATNWMARYQRWWQLFSFIESKRTGAHLVSYPISTTWTWSWFKFKFYCKIPSTQSKLQNTPDGYRTSHKQITYTIECPINSFSYIWFWSMSVWLHPLSIYILWFGTAGLA